MDEEENNKENREVTVKPEFLPPANQELSTDLDYTRKNIYDLIETGHAALLELSDIARQSQNGKVYEALFNALSKMGELNERLVNVSDKKKKVGAEEATEKGGNVTNNLFVGSTAELQKMLDEMNKTDGK